MKIGWLASLFYYMKCSPFFESKKKLDEEKGNHELATKRKPGGWKCMPYIIGNETFEKVASVGLLANFTVYLVKHYNIEQVTAANMANIFFGTTNFAPLLGAFISDAYAGRFRTIAYSSVASLLGMVVLTLTAALPQLGVPSCSPADLGAGHCVKPTSSQLGVLYIALALLAIGGGGIRPCSLPLGVDQFDKFTEEGRQGLNSFFNWYYCTSTMGVVVGLTVVVYIQDINWTIGFIIPTCLMILSIFLFFLGTRYYIYVPPEGSIFSGITQVFVAAIRKRSFELPAKDNVVEQEELLYNPSNKSDRITKLPLTLQFRCLNKAAIKCEGEVKEDGTPANKWRLSAVQQIEEVKCLIRIVPIWASGIICFVALGQQWTFAVLQSLTMDRHLGPHFEIPPGTIGALALLALALFIPIYDQLFVPLARRFTGIESGITLLQRQGIGMVIAAMSMVVAGLVEQKRRTSALAHGGFTPLSAPLWLAPQLILMGIAEAFNAVGQIEFYNRQFPEHMQTLAGSLFFCSLAGASYMSSGLVVIMKKNTSWLNNNINLGRVDYFYYVIAVMGIVNLIYFVVVAHFYRYKGNPELMTVKVVSDQDEQSMERVTK